MYRQGVHILEKDIAMIERVQRRATNLIEGFRDMSYSEHLSHTGLISMEKCRIRGDLIQVFKMLRSKNRVDFNNFFKFSHQIEQEDSNLQNSKTEITFGYKKVFL